MDICCRLGDGWSGDGCLALQGLKEGGISIGWLLGGLSPLQMMRACPNARATSFVAKYQFSFLACCSFVLSCFVLE